MRIFVVRVRGLNLGRLIAEISASGIEVQETRRVSVEELILEISSKEYKKLIDLKISTCYNIYVVKKRAKFPLLSTLVKRLGIIVGVIAAGLFLTDFCSRIWNVNVSFDKEIVGVSSETIKAQLCQEGVDLGSKLNVTTRELEKKLLKAIDESAMVVIERDGINLNVFIKARELKDELLTSNIVAEFDGVIKEIKFSSGILLTNIGEAVVKGQVLIASGNVGDIYNEAQGEIIAKTRISGDAIGAINATSYVRSGNIVEVNYLELFGKKFYRKQTIDEACKAFNNFEIEIEEKLIFNRNILPIKKCVAKIYELKEEIKVNTNAELITSLKAQAYETAKAKLPQGAAEEFVSFDVFNDGEYYRVVCNIETTISIGKRG